jgi:ATP-binding cassette subfamily B protein
MATAARNRLEAPPRGCPVRLPAVSDSDVPRQADHGKDWVRIRHLVRPHRGGVIVLALTSFASGAVEAAFLVVLTRAALAIADGRDEFGVLAGHTASLGLGLGVAALLLIVRLVLGLVGVRVATELAVDVLTEARHRLADAFLHTSWAVQHSEPSGRLQELMGGFAGLASGVVTAFNLLVSGSLNLLALIIASLTINPKATAVVVVALAVLALVVSPIRRRIRAQARSAADAQVAFATTVSELGALGMEMQAFGVRDQFSDRVRDVVATDGQARRRALAVQGAMNPVYICLAYGALLGGVALATLYGTGEIGGAAAVMLVMMRSLSYGQQVQTSIGALSASVPYVDVLDETIERYAAERAPGGTRVIETIGPIDVVSISFGYREDVDVLHDVSFRIAPGEVVGMIGPSGGGKSTLVQLLLGLREPASGRIEVGGVDLREIDRRSWTARTAFVAQDAILVSGTVADNISFFRDGIDDARIERAARQAHILDEVAAMPRGFASQVGPRGGDLSGGQRQRLSIARALAGDPQLLVMDEPTSALDARSESLIRRTIAELKGRVTVIIIAHRLSTLEVCDRIMVLCDGQVRAMDTVASLAANDHFYRESLHLSGLSS